jgi:N-acetyl-anhydromuramyl-L-alanine amidase AmpD
MATADGYYLIAHPNHVKAQYRAGRRAKVTGQIVVHTTESALDVIGDDAGAENVARYISTRDTYGSYHRIGDTDSIVKMVPFGYEAFHDGSKLANGTTSNWSSIGLSLAMRADQWPTLPASKRDALVHNLVVMAVEAADWLKGEHGITVPAVHLTRAEANRGLAGFIGHGERDPGRRSDPGQHFPWQLFIARFEAAMKVEQVMVSTSTSTLDELAGFNQFLRLAYWAYSPSLKTPDMAVDVFSNDFRSWILDATDRIMAGEDLEPVRKFIVWALKNPADAAALSQ